MKARDVWGLLVIAVAIAVLGFGQRETPVSVVPARPAAKIAMPLPIATVVTAAPRAEKIAERKPASATAPVARALAKATGVAKPGLSEPEVRTDGDSTYLTYHQLWRGIQIAPYGKVNLQLDARGEVADMSSEYVARLRVSNAEAHPETDARSIAREAANRLGAARLMGGNPVIWVSSLGANGERVEGRRAYEYNAQGVQVIVDAGHSSSDYHAFPAKYVKSGAGRGGGRPAVIHEDFVNCRWSRTGELSHDPATQSPR